MAAVITGQTALDPTLLEVLLFFVFAPQSIWPMQCSMYRSGYQQLKGLVSETLNANNLKKLFAMRTYTAVKSS